MTTLIPDSWELPSYLAGDVVNMDRYRDRERSTVPDDDWTPGQDARVFDLDYTRSRKSPQPPPPAAPVEVDWSHIEPYDPAKHDPAELYNQNDLDSLYGAGFYPTEAGVWHRPVTTDEGESVGVKHTIFYEPGHRQTSNNRLVPWHFMTDPDSGIGSAHPTLHGPEGALTAANVEAERIRKLPKHARLSAAQSPGRANADDWLEQNTPESFEEDPRAAAHDWMDENSDQYAHWEPHVDDYTYPDVGDAAGQQFDEHGETSPISLPGHFRNENAAMNGDLGSAQPVDEDDEDEEPDYDSEELEAHGFGWEPTQNRDQWVRKQHDLNGKHIATHTIHQDSNGRWNVESGPSDTQDFLTSVSDHYDLGFALRKYKQNSAEALLPQHGYEQVRGIANGVSHWVKTDPSPEGHLQHEDYQHKISFPEHGFLGQTENHTHLPNRALFAPRGNQTHHSEDLDDVVREQQRLASGVHPGGRRDFRLSSEELHADPTVATLGRSETASTPWGDGRANRMTWRLPSPGGSGRPVNAEANYNWDTGNYDFKYTHDGTPLAATHNYVPDGAPVTIPGRQTQLPLDTRG